MSVSWQTLQDLFDFVDRAIVLVGIVTTAYATIHTSKRLTIYKIEVDGRMEEYVGLVKKLGEAHEALALADAKDKPK